MRWPAGVALYLMYAVKRLFSMVSFTKTKARNRMKSALLEYILRVQSELHFAIKCCVDFVCTKKMFAKFCLQEMYSSQEEAEKLMTQLKIF